MSSVTVVCYFVKFKTKFEILLDFKALILSDYFTFNKGEEIFDSR